MYYIEVLQRTYAIVEYGEYANVTCLITRGIATCAAIVGIATNADNDKPCGLFLCHADVFTDFTEPLTRWAKENQEKELNIVLHFTKQTESYHHIYADQVAEIAKKINCPVHPMPLWDTVYALRTGQLGGEEIFEDEGKWKDQGWEFKEHPIRPYIRPIQYIEGAFEKNIYEDDIKKKSPVCIFNKNAFIPLEEILKNSRSCAVPSITPSTFEKIATAVTQKNNTDLSEIQNRVESRFASRHNSSSSSQSNEATFETGTLHFLPEDSGEEKESEMMVKKLTK